MEKKEGTDASSLMRKKNVPLWASEEKDFSGREGVALRGDLRKVV